MDTESDSLAAAFNMISDSESEATHTLWSAHFRRCTEEVTVLPHNPVLSDRFMIIIIDNLLYPTFPNQRENILTVELYQTVTSFKESDPSLLPCVSQNPTEDRSNSNTNPSETDGLVQSMTSSLRLVLDSVAALKRS